jgi:hypothetical protein
MAATQVAEAAVLLTHCFCLVALGDEAINFLPVFSGANLLSN